MQNSQGTMACRGHRGQQVLHDKSHCLYSPAKVLKAILESNKGLRTSTEDKSRQDLFVHTRTSLRDAPLPPSRIGEGRNKRNVRHQLE